MEHEEREMSYCPDCAEKDKLIREQRDEIARLTKLEQECWTSPEQWMAWCDIRVLERAERIEAERDALRKLLTETSDLIYGRSYGKNASDERIGKLWVEHGKRIDAALAKLEQEQGR